MSIDIVTRPLDSQVGSGVPRPFEAGSRFAVSLDGFDTGPQISRWEPCRCLMRHTLDMRVIFIVGVLALAAAACFPADDATNQTEPDPSAANLTVPGSDEISDATDPGGPVVGADGLVADLVVRGLMVEASGRFTTRFLGGRGFTFCIGGQEIRVWEYLSQADRQAASRLIDRNDPSKIGSAFVEWRGDPTFWQRDTILVLYLGNQAETLDVLSELFGPSFAEGRGRSSPNSGDCVDVKQVADPGGSPEEISGFSLFFRHGGGAVYTEGSATEWDLVSSTGTVSVGATLLPTSGEELLFIVLEPGMYTIRTWQRPCPGSCDIVLEPPTAACAARFTIKPGATIEADVTVSPGQGSCSFEFRGTDDAFAADPGDYNDLPTSYPVSGSN